MTTRLHASGLGTRRGWIAATLGLLAAPRVLRAAPSVLLRIGDQRGGTQSVLAAAGQLDGLDYAIEWNQFAQAQPLLEAQNAGALDLGFAGDIAFLFVHAAGAPIRAVGGTQGRGQGQAIVVPEQSPIRRVEDLAGKHVALSRGGLGELLLYGALERAGLGRGDVRVANLPQADCRAALRTGAVDAWATWHPFVAQAEIEDRARVLVDGTGILPGYSFALAHVAAIRDKRPALADLLQRIARAYLWALRNPAAYASQIAAATGLPEPVTRRSVDASRRRPIRITPEVIAAQQRTADALLRYGTLRRAVTVVESFDAGFATDVGPADA